MAVDWPRKKKKFGHERLLLLQAFVFAAARSQLEAQHCVVF
jgi:hypothetical protein